MATYRVQSNGKAQAGLSVGDYVVTGNGTYKINGIKDDGSYQSSKVTSELNTSTWDGSTSFEDWQYKKQNPYALDTDRYLSSPLVTSAQASLDAAKANKPGAYVDPYADIKNGLLDKILNRESFTYDLNGDMLWNQYKDQYTALGKLAMADTVGQAAGLTGGYANTYAVSAGSEAYQNYLHQLNDIVPELYNMAYNRYAQEGQDLYNQYGVVSSESQFDYGQYRDTVGDWQFEYGLANDNYNNALSMSQNDYWNNISYQLEMAQFDYQKQQDALAQENWQKEFDYTTGKTTSSNSGGSRSSGSGSSRSSSSSSSSKVKDDDDGLPPDPQETVNPYYGAFVTLLSEGKAHYTRDELRTILRNRLVDEKITKDEYEELWALVDKVYGSGEANGNYRNQ